MVNPNWGPIGRYSASTAAGGRVGTRERSGLRALGCSCRKVLQVWSVKEDDRVWSRAIESGR